MNICPPQQPPEGPPHRFAVGLIRPHLGCCSAGSGERGQRRGAAARAAQGRSSRRCRIRSGRRWTRTIGLPAVRRG